MQNLLLLLLSLTFTVVLAVIGYFLRTVHIEVKSFIKELTAYTSHLKQLIVGIQTQIDKGIEADIVEIKADIKTLYRSTARLTENQPNPKSNG
ncbi:hypothetical protein NBT05_12410 [Aquimarina sp. ERC-38]|uniref:hypothetical protein n=1 Tax=Aquimarina sp. ERC-38 TaxID=2949996 RepID=UPI0022469717|nr:hypothetical protein [Aquimarina sp. ERC-38]UZO79751.1 hypothetical protein NBT05_12410 [Aquimarina sp. ERC-38]